VLKTRIEHQAPAAKPEVLNEYFPFCLKLLLYYTYNTEQVGLEAVLHICVWEELSLNLACHTGYPD
jgi:hypothetical protein